MRPSETINRISKVSIVLTFLLVLTYPGEVFGQLYSVDFSGQKGKGANNQPSSSANWSVSVNTSNLGGFFEVKDKNNNNVFKAQNTDQAAVWESDKISTSSVSKDVKISFDAFAARGVFENADELKVDAVIDPNTSSSNTINLFTSSKNSSDDAELQSIVLKNSLQKFIEYVDDSNLGNELKIKITADNSAGSEFYGWDNVTVKAENEKGAASNQPQNFSASSSTPYAIDLSWDDASAGSVTPDGYILKAKKGGTPTAPTDGKEPTEDTDLTDGSAVLKYSYQSNSSFSQRFIGLDPTASYTFEIYSYTNALNKIKYKTTSNPSVTKSTNNGSLVYDQSYNGQSGQGRDGNGKSTGNVDWSIPTGSVNGYFEVRQNVRQNEVFQGANLDRKSVWKSDQINISGKSNLSFFFKAKAEGDYEANDDVFKVEAVIDGGTPKTIFSAEVDESATVNGVDDPMVFGGSSVSSGTALTSKLQNFASSIDGSGNNLVIKITAENNVSSEIIGWDDLKVYNNAPKKWDGGASSDNNWSSPANWNPDGVPNSNNRVVLDNTHVNSDYTVNIDQGLSNTSIKSLTIEPNSGQSIDVVRKSGGNAFKLTGAGKVLTIEDDGTFKDKSSVGLPDNFTNGNGEMLIKSGGTYQVLNSSNFSTSSLAGQISSSSSADGEVVIKSTGQTISASGKTYPTGLTLKNNTGSSVSYTTSGSSAFTIEGDFTIGSNVTYDATGRKSGGDLIVKGDFTNNGTFNLNSGVTSLKLKGSSQQTIDGLSEISQLTVDDPQGVKLMNSLTIQSGGTLDLKDGVISFANEGDQVVIESGASVNGGSASSYVAGKVKKKGSSDFKFPVGKSAQYAPIEVTNFSNSSDFTAEYFKSQSNNFVSSSNLQSSSLNNISQNEYWTLDRNNPSGSAAEPEVTLYWKSGMSHGISNLSDLTVARLNSNNNTSSWVDEGNSNTTGNTNEGSVTSNTITSFSEFTFGSTSSNDNALPVELLYFKAAADQGHANLNWATASETNNKHFQVQKQVEGAWENIGTVKGQGTTIEKQTYNFQDPDVRLGQTYYYRLKQVDFDGSYAYSDVKAVSFEGSPQQGSSKVSLYPNPVDDHLNLVFHTQREKRYQLTIQTPTGRKLYHATLSGKKGLVNATPPVSQLQPGSYILILRGAEHTYQKRFIKQR